MTWAQTHAEDLGTIVGMLPDVVFKCVKRDDGEIVWDLNEGALAREFGVTTDVVRGKPMREFFPPDVAERLLPEFEAAFRGEPHEFVNELHGRMFRHYPQPVRDENGDVVAVVGFISDVTHMVKAEEEIRALNAELASKVDELRVVNKQLESFAAAVSHDLRGPLATIGVSAEQLVRRAQTVDDARARTAATRVVAGVDRMRSLIEQIMRIAKATGHDVAREDVDLGEIACAIVEELRAREPGRDVLFTCDHDLVAKGEPELLRIALENLLGNAWKYTRGRARARVCFTRDEDGAFVVADDGPGFDPADASRLFDAFARGAGADAVDGDGVGLWTVKRIVERHGGAVKAEGAPGRGARFSFTLG